MNQQIKDDLMASAILSSVAIGASAFYYWVLNWAWYAAIPAGLVSAFGFGAFLVALPLIYWAIVGD